jgi:hypothetical protein
MHELYGLMWCEIKLRLVLFIAKLSDFIYYQKLLGLNFNDDINTESSKFYKEKLTKLILQDVTIVAQHYS